MHQHNKRVHDDFSSSLKLKLSFVEPIDKQNDNLEELLLLVTSEVSETQAELNTDTTQ